MGNDAQVIIDVITKTDGSTKELRGVNAQLRQMSNSARAAFTPIERVSNSIDKQANMAHKAKFAFQGWALSVMFAGMAMQRAFNAIWQSGSKTFNDIMHSVEGTVTGFDNLNNSITYLQFVAGQALEPLADALVPIIDFHITNYRRPSRCISMDNCSSRYRRNSIYSYWFHYISSCWYGRSHNKD